MKELYLSNNKISEINTKIRSTSKIVCLNLSGNPISNMKVSRQMFYQNVLHSLFNNTANNLGSKCKINLIDYSKQ